MNPYNLSFGKKPNQSISRMAQLQPVLEDFRSAQPSQQVYILSGVRGSGKTVAMTELAESIQKEDDWIVVECNPQRDLLMTLVAKLTSLDPVAQIIRSARINLSFFGFGLSIETQTPVTDIEVALEQILIALKKKNKKVLVCIDEVSNTKNIRTFIHSFQILIRKECPLFLLMTGLYENIYTLQNDKSLTFLYRAPKIELAPLNIGTIAANYQTNFRCSNREALEMARLTKGYSFAFQVLGYLRWNQKTYDEQTRLDFKQYLEDYVYEKIWMECSGNDQAILYAMAKSPTDKIAVIRSQLNIDTNAFNPYRQRLIRKGLVNGSVHSHLTFTLPYFDRFVLEHYNL